MKWILLDVAIALLALAVLAVLVLRLYRAVKRLSRTVTEAGEAVARASEGLEVAQGGRHAAGPQAGDARAQVSGAAPAGRSLSGSSPRRGARS